MKIRKHYLYRRIAMLLAVMILVGSLTGCGNEYKKKVFDVRNQSMTKSQVLAYGLIYANEQNLVSEEGLEEKYNGDIDYREHYKMEMQQEIIDMLLLYEDAKGEKVTKKQQKNIDAEVSEIMSAYSTEFLENLHVDQEELSEVLTMRQKVNNYGSSLAEANQETDTNEQYVKVYEVVFPTVEMDDEGKLKTDQDGQLIALSNSEVQEIKTAASEFAQKAQNGKSMETLLKEYDNSVIGANKYYKRKDLPEKYQSIVDGLTNETGKRISSVFELDYGYYVIELLEENSEERGEILKEHEKETASAQAKEQRLSELYDKYVKDSDDYLNSQLWDGITVEMFIK